MYVSHDLKAFYFLQKTLEVDIISHNFPDIEKFPTNPRKSTLDSSETVTESIIISLPTRSVCGATKNDGGICD